MRFLRALGFIFVVARFVWNVFRAEIRAQVTARRLDGFGRKIETVGAHVGNPTRLVQLLRQAHGAISGQAKRAARALKRAGLKWRIGARHFALALNACHFVTRLWIKRSSDFHIESRRPFAREICASIGGNILQTNGGCRVHRAFGQVARRIFGA